MYAYIKRRTDFKTVSAANVTSWDTPLASIDNDSGSVVLVGEQASRGAEGDFLIMEGNVWLIEEIAFDKGLAKIKVGPVAKVFDRSLLYTAPAASTRIEDWIKSQIETNYKSCRDPAYAMPYFTVSASGSTAWAAPDTDDDNLFVLEEYLQTVHNLYGIKLSATVEADKLHLLIEKKNRANFRIVFTDGQAQLLSEAYSRQSVAKITTIQGTVTKDWYLSASGEISNTVPAQRAAGEWKTLVLKDKDVDSEKVAAQFAKNSCSHKVEFMCSRRYELYDKIQLRLGNTVVSSYISYVGIRSGDSRYYYKTGELKTTLTQMLKGAISNERNSGRDLR